MTDREVFMAHWTPTYGEQKAAELWELKQQHSGTRGPGYIADTEGYLSPVTGKWVEGRKARRDDLARSGCRPWEGMEQEQKEAQRQKAYIEQKQDAKLTETAWRTWYAMDPKKRRQLMQG